MPVPYYAHSSPDRSRTPPEGWQLLNEHLRNVAELARTLAREMSIGIASLEEAGLEQAAYAAGWLHDLGKYRRGFQDYLNGLKSKGDPLTLHKQAGAKKAKDLKLAPVAFAVFGHHGGLPDKTDLETALKEAAADYDPIWNDAVNDCPVLGTLQSSPPNLRDPFQADLFTRVLFSCLVDADWADTGEHQRRVLKLPEEPMPPSLDADQRYERVEKYLSELTARPLEPHVKKARADVLAACLDNVKHRPGLFSLTVPTGGGKTLASLAFALRHAASHGLRRIIYVAPYMTILEQNADVIRSALGIGPNDPAVFEHYSLAEPPGDDSGEETGLSSPVRRAENWDAPFIITTNVQFFESLFSNQPGRCRKLHNIARSVIILDECQTLPPGLAAPTCGMLKQLTAELGCTIVLCTATRPAFDHESLKHDERLAATEIIPETMRQRDKHDLFVRLKRVSVSWPKQGEVLDWPDVAAQMLEEKAALCVVNTKKAARAVFEELHKTNDIGVFHLSTGMCPQHRREKLAVIKSALGAGAPCYVISTQLIEAGVDVDFPFLMREIGPLESIIQAAGRCNREGKLAGGGRVLVFRSVDGGLPKSTWYKQGRDIVDQVLSANGAGPQIDDAEAIRDYFSRLYWGGDLDAGRIRDKRIKFQFKTIALGEEHGKHAYRLIDNPGEPVVVPTWKSHGEEVTSLLEELAERPRKSVFRRMARFQVNLLPSQRLKSAHLLHEGPAEMLVWDGKYDESTGIIDELLDDVLVV
jgi:CRISPR-associated helicase Cas3/CRISPR-associated endonuclease Cas3-HD